MIARHVLRAAALQFAQTGDDASLEALESAFDDWRFVENASENPEGMEVVAAVIDEATRPVTLEESHSE